MALHGRQEGTTQTPKIKVALSKRLERVMSGLRDKGLSPNYDIDDLIILMKVNGLHIVDVE